MRKLISLALALVMSLALAIPASAAEVGTAGSNGSVSVTISADATTFNVSIPTSIRKKIEAIPNKDKRQAEWDRFTELNIDSYMFKMNPENMADWRLNKLVEICDAYHEFGVLATLRDLFFQIYKAENREAANQAYWKWKMRIPKHMDEYAEMRRIANRTFKT